MLSELVRVIELGWSSVTSVVPKVSTVLAGMLAAWLRVRGFVDLLTTVVPGCTPLPITQVLSFTNWASTSVTEVEPLVVWDGRKGTGRR